LGLGEHALSLVSMTNIQQGHLGPGPEPPLDARRHAIFERWGVLAAAADTEAGSR
jgi:hypothetical protein